MDIIDELRAFVATARTGSFTGAAEQLGVSNRLTSKYVAELESRLGVRLFQRTTRRVGLTPAGEDLLARAPALLDDLDEMLAGLSESSRNLSGVIRISAPVTFGERHVAKMLGRFAARHTGVAIDLRLHDAFVDLASEGIDVAFRIGQSDMLSLKVRKLGELHSLAVASPSYVADHGCPERPEDLAAHSCIIDTNRRVPRRWVFVRDGAEHVVDVQGRLQVNSARAVVGLAEAGLGISYAPHFAVAKALEAGTLIAVLSEYRGVSVPVSAVYLEGRAMPRKIRALIDFAAEDLREAGLASGTGFSVRSNVRAPH